MAARTLGTLTTAAKDRALHAAADAVLANIRGILAGNAEDLDAARAAGTPAAMLDRLALNPSASTASPPACVRWPGCRIRSVRCCRGRTPAERAAAASAAGSAGWVGIVYEGRPNVTVDAFG